MLIEPAVSTVVLVEVNAEGTLAFTRQEGTSFQLPNANVENSQGSQET